MTAPIELNIGDAFGRWVVSGLRHTKGSRSYYQCLCECGTASDVIVSALVRGASLSCGCLRRERALIASTTHGESKRNRLYIIWQAMIGRCSQPGHPAYKNYGARGIFVCAQWAGSYESFRDWSHSSGYSDNLSIDRIDNDGAYEPGNCRWADTYEQSNNKRNTVFLTAFKEHKAIGHWAKDHRCKVSKKLLEDRIRKNWTTEDAITTPPDPRPIRKLTAFGETKSLSEWARDSRCNTGRKGLSRRIERGISIVEAMRA